MELIPILSLIILVATISTFILAVGAYILYKIRERKGRQQAAQPASVPAELVAPAPMMAEQAARTTGRRTYTRDTYQEPIYAPTRETGPQMRPTFVGNAPATFTEASRYQRTDERERVTADAGRYTSSPTKFMRYTNEGYVEPTKQREKKKDEKGSLKWR